MTQTSQRLADKNDGILLCLMAFAASEFGWPLSYVLDDVSMLSLLLLLRQKAVMSGQCMMSLADKEMIDRGGWDELVKQNRQQIAKQLEKMR